MRRRHRFTVSVALTAALALVPSNASANGRASLSWTLPRTASAGQAIGFTWHGSHLGKGRKLVIQKPMGTAHTWRTILRLPTNSGSAQLPSLPLGKYRLRIADLAGRYLLAQQAAGVAVFGEVPFSMLFNSPERAYATPKYSFPYIASWEDWGNSTAFTVEHNHCNSVHIGFVGAGWVDQEAGNSGVFTLTVVQESHEPTSASSPWETIGSLDAELVPGQTWAVKIAASAVEPELYINGYAVCDSIVPFQ
jgi:hypothetical protein